MSALQEIKKVIELADGEDQALELNLSQIEIVKFTPEIKRTIENCKELQVLILAGCNLTSLDNLPQNNLTAIDLSDNKLNDQQLTKLTKYTNLGQLLINENNITKLQSIKVLSKLQKLQQLDLSDNPVSQQLTYREFIWKNLKGLKVLDMFDQQGNEQVPSVFDDDQDDGEEDEGQGDDDGQENSDEPNSDDVDEDQDQDEQQDSLQPQKRR